MSIQKGIRKFAFCISWIAICRFKLKIENYQDPILARFPRRLELEDNILKLVLNPFHLRSKMISKFDFGYSDPAI
jgi:hypothetical protein